MEAHKTISDFLLDNQIDQIKLRVTSIAIKKFPNSLVYHNIALINRVVNAVEEICDNSKIDEERKRVLIIAAWLKFIGFAETEKFEETTTIQGFFDQCLKYSLVLGKEIMQEIGIPFEKRNAILDIIKASSSPIEPQTEDAEIIMDAIFSDYARPLGEKYIQKLYREFLLTEVVAYSSKKWVSNAIDFLMKHDFHTEYGKRVFETGKIDLIQKLEKRKKQYTRTDETILKKQMEISADELKTLKKTLKKIKGRNERGIQTMFRTTSRNHYTLNQMLDRKANILISINSIIISIIIGRAIGGSETMTPENLPILIIMFTALVSILFAILAIMPEKTHGEFSIQEIRNKEGNLLFFGNYHNMTLRDYEWGMLQMINDGEHLYMTMIKDLYFFGKQLGKRYKLLRISLTSLAIGLTISILSFLIV